jgi:nucleoside-diphosphate-sugar epimerase
MQTLVLGCGYVGAAFGAAMQTHGPVLGTCRSAEAAEVLRDNAIEPVVFDGSQVGDLCAAADKSDFILACIPPTSNGDEAFIALEALLRQTNKTWIGYLSTTGTYGDRRGGWAFEDDELTPLSLEASRRVAAEANWVSLPKPAHIFRLPGIYGPWIKY